MRGNPPELAELTALFCDGDLSSDQAARLELLVAESAAARQYVVECYHVHCELAWELGREVDGSSQLSSADHDCATAAAGSAVRRPLVPSGVRPRWTPVSMSAALLLTIAVGLGLTVYVRRSEQTPLRGHVAHIGQTKDVRWSDGSATEPATPLPAGQDLAIQQGLLEVCFDSGATIILQGPAEIELRSSNSAVLHDGSVTANVPEKARGFSITTPNATLVDLGTSFGAACDAKQTDVEVFTGNVLVRPGGRAESLSDAPAEQRLTANEAVRVSGTADSQRLRMEAIPAGSRNYVRSLQDCVECVAPACACPTVPQAAADLIGRWHCPQGTLVPIDFGRRANWSDTDSTPDRTGNNLVEFPAGRRLLAGVEFQIPKRRIQLHGMRLPDLPRVAEGIPVDRAARRLFILHGTQFAQPTQDVKDGDLIAEYRVRYADGTITTIPVVVGQDVPRLVGLPLRARYSWTGGVGWPQRGHSCQQHLFAAVSMHLGQPASREDDCKHRLCRRSCFRGPLLRGDHGGKATIPERETAVRGCDSGTPKRVGSRFGSEPQSVRLRIAWNRETSRKRTDSFVFAAAISLGERIGGHQNL